MAAFAASLLARSMLVTLPFVLLLLDHWPLRRLSWRTVAEKWPLFVLTAAASAHAWIAQVGGPALANLEQIPVVMRMQNALISYARYLLHALWPPLVSPYHGYPGHFDAAYPDWVLPAAIAFLLAATAGVTTQARKRPYLLVGWLFYLGTMVPNLGLVRVGNTALADRYTYVPLTGVVLALVWLVADLLRKRPAVLRGAAAAWAAAAVGLALLTRAEIPVWRTQLSLWSRAVESAPRAPLPRYALGRALKAEGRLDEAVEEFQACIATGDTTRVADCHSEIGLIYKAQGKPEEAVGMLARAVELSPEKVDLRGVYANTLAELGQGFAAEIEYREALEYEADPRTRAVIHRNYGVFLLLDERFPAGIEQCRKALELARSAENYVTLAVAYHDGGRRPDAVKLLREGLAAHPGHPALSQLLRAYGGG